MVSLKNFHTSNITKKYLRWLKDKEVTKYTSIKSNQKLNQIYNYIKQHQNNKIQKIYRIFYFKKHVGNIRISYISKDEVSFGILIGEKNFQSRNIGSKAFKLLIKILRNKNVKSIVAHVSNKNRLGVNFFKKNSFFIINSKKYLLNIKRDSYLIFKLNI